MKILSILLLGAVSLLCADDTKIADFVQNPMKTQNLHEQSLVENALNGDLSVISTDMKIDEVKESGEYFIISKRPYRALTKSCEGWEKGDFVRDLSHGGKCLNTILLNLRTKSVCKVLCDA